MADFINSAILMGKTMSAEKTEKPTDQKLKDARKKGDVPRSKELPNIVILLYAFICFYLFGDKFLSGPKLSAQKLLNPEYTTTITTGTIFPEVLHYLENTIYSLFFFFFGLIILSVISNVALGGFTITASKTMPKFKNISIISGIKKMFSKKQVVEIIKSLLKAALVLVPLSLILESKLRSYFDYKGIYNITSYLDYIAKDIIFWGLLFSALFIIVVLIDVPFQIYNYKKELRMTKQDIKDEYKNSEGNPEIKSKRRSIQQQMSQKARNSNIDKADILIVNPTHYAVGLMFDPNTMETPLVVALGADNIALSMRAKVTAMRKPVLELPPLARALYSKTEVGQSIPFELYEPVAVVISYIYSLEDRMAFDINSDKLKNISVEE